MHCEGKKTATVELIRPDGSKISIQLDSPPIQSELKKEEFGPCGRPGSWWVDTFDRITETSPFTYGGAEKESPKSSGRKIYANCSNRLLYEDRSDFAGSIQLRNPTFTPADAGDNYELKITDSSGKIHKETFRKNPGQQDPKINIRCDDDCPEGFIKGYSNRPPGYCCIPCEEARISINTIKAMLKG